MSDRPHTALYRLIFRHWQRKALSVFVACILWLVVSHSMTTTRRLYLPVHVINLAPDLAVEGLDCDGYLERSIALQVTGPQAVLDRLGPKDLEVVVDATGHRTPWSAEIAGSSVVATSPLVDLSRAIRYVMPTELTLQVVPKVLADVPVHVRAIGALPEGYRLVGLWPGQLTQPLEGPAPRIQQLQREGLTLSIPLAQVPSEELERLTAHAPGTVVYWPIPDSWKQLALPWEGTNRPLSDPQSSHMMLEIVRGDGWVVPQPVPISLVQDTPNPQEIHWGAGTAIWDNRRVVAEPIQLVGCSHRFVEAVGPHLEWLVRLSDMHAPEVELAIHGKLQAQERYLDLVRQDGGSSDDAIYLEQFDREWRRLEAQRTDGTPLTIALNTTNSGLELACQ